MAAGDAVRRVSTLTFYLSTWDVCGPLSLCATGAHLILLMEVRMNRAPVWFERKFEFTFPVEMHPNLCARLRGTPARLEEVVRDASRDALVRRPVEKWSAQEHAGHLVDLETMWMTRVGDYLSGGSELTAADLKNRKTHEANHNARSL